jgi:hypothetical protein
MFLNERSIARRLALVPAAMLVLSLVATALRRRRHFDG